MRRSSHINTPTSDVTSATIDILEAATAALRRGLDLLETGNLAGGGNGTGIAVSATGWMTRLEVALDAEVDPLGWLAAQSDTGRTYWAGRDGDSAIAGVGEAASHHAPAAASVRQVIGSLEAVSLPVRWYGGMRFDTNALITDDSWRPFGAYRFAIPRFELTAGPSPTLACHVAAGDLGAARRDLAQLRPTIGPINDTRTRVISRNDSPDRPGWDQAVASALQLIGNGSMAKVVLGRRVMVETTGVDPLATLRGLEALGSRAYRFLFQPDVNHAFFGATPERLCAIGEKRVVTEAVAGTRHRGEDGASHGRLRDELLGSDKDRREHRFVHDAIVGALESLWRPESEAYRPTVLQLARVQHLYTRLTGTLQPGAGVADVVDALHPTPAVGGFPTDVALEAIADLEPFDRGWYAGPIGWVAGDTAEFAVGIRSCLLADDAVSLYSGNGIVSGSEAGDEWQEMDHKIEPMLDSLAGRA